MSSVSNVHDISNSFHNHSVGEAAKFDMIWIPKDCSYRRFTNNTLLQAVNAIRQQRHYHNLSTKSDPLHLVFFGDSALRGIFCAIFRVYAGSETLGPCMNSICGFSKTQREISIPRIHIKRDVTIGENLLVSFYYVKTFHFQYKRLDQLMEQVIKTDRPYAVVFNTGAWDYYDYSKQHRGEEAPLRCHNHETEQIGRRRADDFVNQTMWRLSEVGAKHHVRLIYRNNHYNARFGALCADEAFEKLLIGSKWEIWDNRRLSEAVWRAQLYDGFHFDWPVMTYTEEDHRAYNVLHRQQFGQHPGMLAQQYGQSLLNALFYSALKDL